MAISTAVGLERVSKIVGYQILKGNFSKSTPNLPMRIAILGEANTANQSSLSFTKREVTSAQDWENNISPVNGSKVFNSGIKG